MTVVDALRGRAGVLVARPHASGTRMGWMDALRGLAVSLVILFHACQYAQTSGFGEVIQVANQLVAPLRMPLMVFLSGLLVPRSLAKGAGPFLLGKVRGILHPYAVWTMILIALWTGPLGIMPFTWRRVIESLWEPFDHLWFLLYLFWYYVLALITRPVRPALVAGATFAAAVVLTALTGETKQFAFLATFFLLGVDVAKYPSQWSDLLSRRVVHLLVVSAVGLLVSLPFWRPTTDWYAPQLMPAVSLVLVALWQWMTSRAHVPRFRVLEAVGRDSIVYYVVHQPVLVVVRQLVQPFDLGWLPVVTLGLIAAVGTSALLAHLRHRSRAVAFLFAWPSRSNTRA